MPILVVRSRRIDEKFNSKRQCKIGSFQLVTGLYSRVTRVNVHGRLNNRGLGDEK